MVITQRRPDKNATGTRGYEELLTNLLTVPPPDQGTQERIGSPSLETNAITLWENKTKMTRHPQFFREADRGHWDQCLSEPRPRGSADY
jgi:hypothetical protein